MSDKKDFDRDSISNTLIVAIGLSLVCSIVVSSAAIALKPIQQKNEELFRQQIILDVAGLMEPDADITALFEAIEARESARAEALAREHARLARKNLNFVTQAKPSLIDKVPGLALPWDKLFHTAQGVPCKCDMR